MASLAGRNATISTSATSGGTYAAILGIATVNGGVTAAPIDDSELGISWVQKLTGILDNKASLEGGFRPADSTGQMALRAAMIAGTTVWIKFLFDGSSYGWKQEMIVSKFQADGDVHDRIKVSIDLEGTGAVTFLP